jgi:hypothetical protein
MVSHDWAAQHTHECIVGWPDCSCVARALGRFASNQQRWRNPPLIVRGEISRAGPGGWVPTHCIQDNTALKVPTDRPLAFKEMADSIAHFSFLLGLPADRSNNLEVVPANLARSGRDCGPRWLARACCGGLSSKLSAVPVSCGRSKSASTRR